VLIALDLVIITVVMATGGTDLTVGGIRIRLALFNPLQVLWALVVAWLWLRWSPRARVRTIARAEWTWATLALSAAIAVVLATPLWLELVKLAYVGDYVSQPLMWRSGPQGVDLATMIAGNPFSAWTGAGARSLEHRFAIDAIERTAWLGLMPMYLMMVAWRRGISPAVRSWTIVGGIAFIWALGPHLSVFGHNTGMILPEAVLRYLPVISNARIPGRAMVVVYLALAVLGALGFARQRQDGLRQTLSVGVIAFCAIDFLPAPFPLLTLDHPALFDVLRSRPEVGAVLDVPLGIRDGFGELGALDTRILWYQTIHERPVVGGFVARLAPSIERVYQADPLLSALLRASSRGADDAVSLPTPDVAVQSLRQMHVAFVVLNNAAASPSLAGYVRQLGLTRLMVDRERELFRVDPVR
jgi:hypothetical protein